MGIIERKAREKERRRKEIMDSARKLFIKNRVDRTTMDMVAEEAELSKGTLYLYFKSKEELHFSILMEILEKLSEILKEKIKDCRSGIEKLKKLGEGYLEFFNNFPDEFYLITQFHSGAFEKISDQNKLKLLSEQSPLSLLEETIRSGQTDGTIRPDVNSKELMAILWSQINGLLEFIAYRKNLIRILNLQPENLIKNSFKILTDGLQV